MLVISELHESAALPMKSMGVEPSLADTSQLTLTTEVFEKKFRKMHFSSKWLN
jgi:hypothetical protein